MNNKISQQELAASFAARKELPKKQAELFVRTMFEIVQEYVVKEGIVKIKGLGTFKLINVESRASVDVSTGERIQIDSHSKITFTPDKALADQVNKPFAGFTTVILNPDTKLEDMESMELDESLLPELTPEELAEDLGTEDLSAYEPKDEPMDKEEEIISNDEEAEETSEADEEAEEEPKEEEVEVIEQPEEQPAELAEEDNMTKETKMVDAEVIQQMVMNAVSKEMKKQRGVVLSWGWVAACMMLIVLMLIGSFLVGYYMGGDTRHPIFGAAVESKADVTKAQEAQSAKQADAESKKKEEAQQKAKEAEKEDKAADAATPAPVELQVKPVEAKPAVKYEQMPGGAYEIVGVKGEHVMKAGDNLLKIARKNYGDMELASYIVFFNHIENPDLVPLGATLKLPELVKK